MKKRERTLSAGEHWPINPRIIGTVFTP